MIACYLQNGVPRYIRGSHIINLKLEDKTLKAGVPLE
jgi:hypothetical protein